MPYLFEGTSKQLFQSYGQEWLIAAHPTSSGTIDDDLRNTLFLGDHDAAQHYLNLWRSSAVLQYYCNGNMAASNLYSITNFETYEQNFLSHHFAFINDAKEPCALSLMYHKDKPDQWLYSIIRNTHLAPEQRKVMLFSGANLDKCVLQKADNATLRNQFLKFSNSALLNTILNSAFAAPNSQLNRMLLLARFLRTQHNEQVIDDPIDFSKIKCHALFLPNTALDLVLEYQLHLPISCLKNCLEDHSELAKELKALTLGDDRRLNKSLLRLLISLYDNKLLDQHRELLENQALVKEFGPLLANSLQTKLFPILVKRQYDKALIKLILLEEHYCQPITTLAELGLLQNVAEYLKKQDKLAILKKIHEQKNEDIKKIALVFWAKGDFSENELNHLIAVAQQHPLLAETLLILDKTPNYTVEKLKKLINIPKKHLQKSIRHHYKEEFKNYKLHDLDLKELEIAELEHLRLALDVLKTAGIKQADYYRFTLKKNYEGQLLRLILPQLRNKPNCNKLLEILYIGIKHGVVSQGQAVEKISATDPVLKTTARALHERFICVKQMQDLMQDSDFKQEQIALAAEPNSIKAQRFRRVIFCVEEQCKNVHEILLKSKTEYKKNGKWERADMEYRRKIYNIAYQGINNSGKDLEEQLLHAEKAILDIVDPKITSLVQKVLTVIANVLITVFSLGIANDIKFSATGNYWFFNQSPSGEKIRALNKEVLPLIKPTAPFFGG